MLKLADLIEQHKETLATIETWDNGISYPDLILANAYPSRQTVPGFAE